jgi:hypothetical protein
MGASFLAVLLDLDSVLASISSKQNVSRTNESKLNFSFVFSTLTAFLHTFCLLHRENRILLIAHGAIGAHIVYPNIDECENSSVVSFIPWLPTLSSTVEKCLSEVLELEIEHSRAGDSKRSLSAALSNALTIIHKQKLMTPISARILVLQLDRDNAQNYNAVMNCIFRCHSRCLLLVKYATSC